MKPLRLRFGAFGPYREPQEIDFTDLSRKGLFLICGETGSGKTMILDAITFALYGKSSGNMRDELEALRCRQSDWGEDTFVDFEFEISGKNYRFERRLECKRKNLSQSQNVYLKNKEGIYDPLFENCKKGDMDAMAKELLGLDYDQFRQVIILPQGQFEKLLVSGSEEKEKILMSIFGVDKWQKLAEHFYRHAEERVAALKQLRDKLLNSLAEEECSTLPEFRERIGELEEQLEQEEAAYLQADYDGRKAQLEKQRELGRAFMQLHALEEKLKQVEDRAPQQKERIYRKEQAEAAEVLRSVFERLESLQADSVRRQKQVQNGKKDLIVAQELVTKVQRQQEDLEKQSNEMEELSRERLINGQKRDIYQNMEQLQQRVEVQNRIWKQEESLLNQKRTALATAEQRALELREQFEEGAAHHKALLNSYVSNIAGILAKELQDGEACPVCGSTHHPAKALVQEGDISKEAVDGAKRKADEIYEWLGEALSAGSQAREAMSAQEQVYFAADNQKKALEAEQAVAGERLIQGIPDLAAYDKWMAAADKRLQEYHTKLADVQEAQRMAREQLVVCKSNLENAERELEAVNVQLKEQQIQLKEGITAQGFIDEESARQSMLQDGEMKQLCSDIDKYVAEHHLLKKQVEEALHVLNGSTEPDMAACMQELQALEQMKEAYIGRREAGIQSLKRKQDKARRLQESYDKLDRQWTGAETDFTFAKTLRGDTGTGLQRYVLGIMFSSVIVAANKMLEQVHDGRYRLYRSDERSKGSNKRGLELKVYDSFSTETEGRSVKTLSGGEKFLVSLALSIGMSTVAQKSGIRIEAMFIDEGFGSLDQNSIEDAMGILSGIQKSNGLVGIISHVQVLQDNIPGKLQVVKAREGSRIVSNIG